MMCKLKRSCLMFWLIVLWMPLYSNAQNAINFTSITAKEGLASNTVSTIIKDRYGLMWFGTTNGLTKYDGTNFITYRHDPENSGSLPANEVLVSMEDKTGTLWIATGGGGLCAYDRESDRFVPFKGDGSWAELPGISIRALCQDHEGWIWVATYSDLRKIDPRTGRIVKLPILSADPEERKNFVALSLLEDSHQQMWVGTNQGLYLYNRQANRFTRFVHEANNPNSLSSSIVKCVAQDTRGNLWLGTFDGLNKWLGGNNFKAYRHNGDSRSGISNNTIFSLSANKNGTLWVGTEDGVDIYSPTTDSFEWLASNPRNIFSLKNNSIRSIFIDKAGIYWVGTFAGGISKYDQHLPLFNLKLSDPFDPAGLKSPFVPSITAYPNGKIVIGTDGAGIEFFDRKTGLFTLFTLRSKLSPDRKDLVVMALYVDRKGNLWAGTYHNGLFRIDANGQSEQFLAGNTDKNLSCNDITAITEDSKGNIWIGTLGHGVDIYDPAGKRFSYLNNNKDLPGTQASLPINDFISAIAVSPGGDVWIGSPGTGIAVYHPNSKTFTLYTRENSHLANGVISHLLVAKDGTVWVATNQGISYFDKATRKFQSFTEKDGLASGFAKMILEGDEGLLWVSTDRGISSFDRKRKLFRNFGAENGVQQGAFLVGSGVKASNGDVFFGGQDGFNYFNPAKLPNPSVPGPVLLNDLKVSNVSVIPGEQSPIKQQINIAKEMVLKYGQNFAISYGVLDFTSAKQAQYAYRLKGYDKDWNYVHRAHTANYTNIDPGTYVFQVKANNNDKAWDTPVTEIKITILPPFWRSIYAYIIYFLLIGGSLLWIRRRGINKIRREFEIEQEKLQVKQLIEHERLEAERLHELDLLKIKFLTDLSHEFRTPISLILAPVEKLLERNFEVDDAEHLHMINRNVRRLLNLVNQLLDIRKMEEQELKLELIQADAISFIRETADSFKDIAVKKQITFQIKVACDNWTVLFDKDKIERIIFNLLSNAFKFTPKGGVVSLSMELTDLNEERPALLVKVSDTGIGISADHIDKIFDRFYQVDNQDAVIKQGTGIGLSITREFVELHGGNVAVKSTPGRGTEFSIKLPLVRPEPSAPDADDVNVSDLNFPEARQPAEGESAEDKATDQRVTVLLVEDNDELRYYLADHLSKHYRIIEAANGKEGWQKALSAHPQLVISDISMPYMSGIELSKKLKADKRTCHIPVILLTAMTGEEEQLRGLQSGANDYLTKPFNFQILLTKVANLLDLNKHLKDTYTKQIQVTSEPLEIESTDVKLLNKVIKYIDDRLSDPDLSVEDLSKHVGMSRGSLYYKLRELTGLTPIEYMRTVKLDKAAVLLENSDYNVAQVAYMTGFGTPSYFSRMFKAKYGVLPSEYLNTKRGNKGKINTSSVSE